MLKRILEGVFHASGALNLVRNRQRDQLRILMYHRFADTPETRHELARQCRHLRRYYHPVTLSEAAAALREGRSLAPNSIAITIDDGYADARVAGAVFREHGLRATLYVVTEYLDGNLWLWPDVVHFTCRNTRRASAEVPVPGEAPLQLRFGTPEERELSDAALDEVLLRLPDGERRALIQALPQILEAPLPHRIPARYEPISWQELAALDDVFEVGAHTRTHPVLSRVEKEDQLRDEVAGSRARIEAALGRPVRHFCYPNGTAADYNPQVVAAVAASGFETAVTTLEGTNPGTRSPFEWRRIGAEPDHSPRYFERRVAGWRQRLQ